MTLNALQGNLTFKFKSSDRDEVNRAGGRDIKRTSRAGLNFESPSTGCSGKWWASKGGVERVDWRFYDFLLEIYRENFGSSF